MEFRKIVYFLKVAEKLNFTKAAQELYISPQALSKQIQELEQRVGFALFSRSTTEVKLTAAGLDMQQRFSPLLSQWQKAWEETLSNNKVKITFFGGLPQGAVVSKIIKYFADTHSEWQLELLGKELQEVKDYILEEKADLALTTCHAGEQWEGCTKIPLYTIPACLVFPKDHVIAQRGYVTEEDLFQMKFVFLKQKFIYEHSFYGQIPKENVIFADDSTAVVQLIALGKGTCALPGFPNQFDGQDLVTLPLPESYQFDFQICLLFKQKHILKDSFSMAAEVQLFS